MNYKNSIEKFIEIFKRSNLSISKFASMINKDRRTVTSWIDNVTDIEPNKDIKDKFVRFSDILIIFGKRDVMVKSF